MKETIQLHSLTPRWMGLIVLTAGAVGYWVYVTRQLPMNVPLAIPLLVIALVILWLLFAPCRLVLDRHQRLLSTASLMSSSPLARLDELQGILVRCETVGSEESQVSLYCIRLKLPGSEPQVATARDYTEARRISEKLAGVLKVDITDVAQGEASVRSHRELDKRWVEAQAGEEELSPPPESLLVISSLPHLRVQISRTHPSQYVPALLFAGLALAFMVPILKYDLWLACLLLLVQAVVLGPSLLTGGVGSTVLEAAPGVLRAHHKMGPLAWSRSFDLAGLEEVRLDHGLILVSDRAVERINCRITPEAGAWLKEALLRAVGSTAR